MKLLFENWRKHLREGDIIDIRHLLPLKPTIDHGPNEEEQKSLELVIKIEDMAANKLAELHGNQTEIPIEKINILEKIIDELEGLLKI